MTRIAVGKAHPTDPEFAIEELNPATHLPALRALAQEIAAHGPKGWSETAYGGLCALMHPDRKPGPDPEEFDRRVSQLGNDPMGIDVACHWVCVEAGTGRVVALMDTTRREHSSHVGNMLAITSTKERPTRPAGERILAALVGWLCENHRPEVIVALAQTNAGRQVLGRVGFVPDAGCGTSFTYAYTP